MIAIAGFLLPQEVPLVWAPLNDPGQEILYLEIACVSDQPGHVQLFHNTTRGIRELDSISWPVSPSTQAFTYTFPLPDAPITELRLDPVANGGTLTVTRLRVIDRRGTEIRRFTKDDVIPVQQIAAVTPLPNGWSITSAAGSPDPFVNLLLPAPILAREINHRSLLRCLLSGGYLALMLWLLLLLVLFVFYRPASGRDGFARVAFMAALALIFSAVGNRGLIKDSLRYARFEPPVAPPGASLEIDLATDQPLSAQLFWDTGRGINEADSARVAYSPHRGLQTLRFPLPAVAVNALRFDPLDGEARIVFRGLRVVDSTRRTLAVLPLGALEAGLDIASAEMGDGEIRVTTAAGKKDPILNFNATAIKAVNAAIVTAAPR